jgi:hypothetical protein
MNKHIQILVVATVICAAAEAGAADLGEFFGDEGNWASSPEAFLQRFMDAGFRFVDKGCAVSDRREALRFLELEVCEARVYFAPDKTRIERVRLSLYNKGDAGRRDRETFEESAEAVKKRIAGFAGEPGMTGRTSNDRPNYFVKRHQWVKRSPGIQLEWAYVEPHRSEGKSVPYSAEFVAVTLAPVKAGGGVQAAPGSMATAARVRGAQRSIRENVTRNATGDVWIANLPMVDQGQKGYCAAAASERVLRYYAIEVDQHQIAQLADTAAEGGTTLEGMAKAVSKVGRQFQLDKKELIAPDSEGSFEKSDHAKLLEEYNAVAKKKKAPQIDWKMYTANYVVDVQEIWREMDPEILLAARSGQKQAMNQFVRNVALYVDQGVPLLWSCLVGMYPEEPPLGEKGAFGHVRLIIGYNTKTKEILYSDSWGPDHALKRLPLDQAWAMTKGVIVLKPRGVR